MASGQSRRPSESQIVGPNQPNSRAGADGSTRGGDVGKKAKNEEFHQPESQGLSMDGDGLPRTQRSQHATISSTKEKKQLSEPPVTKNTLSELDVNKIVNNPKLRHDINFDPELHFRPNIDGDKGKRKSQKANLFWSTMKTQLEMFVLQRDQFEKEIGTAEWALPGTLRAIRDILETLVPQRDRSSVEETFNVDLLMQQFQNGAADMSRLSGWLSQLLKSHCAPMRDDWVDEMVSQFSDGDRNGDFNMIAKGMKSLLGILEAMKLDVANHQIRCLRPILIEDTVHFEQKFFMKKIDTGRIDVTEAHAWYKRADVPTHVAPHVHTNQLQSNTWTFMKALVYLVLPKSFAETIPQTFLFDEERLVKLRSDMQDLINLDVCMYLYQQLNASTRSLESQLSQHHTSSYPEEMDLSDSDTPSPRSSSTQPPRQFHRTVEIRKRWSASPEDDCAMSSASSSPSASPASNASTPDAYPPSPFSLSNTSLDRSSEVRSSLVAILNSASSSDKWKPMAPSLALQVLRSTSTPLTHLPRFEAFFCAQISNPDSRIYQEAESRVLNDLLALLQILVDRYTPLTSLQIFEAATGQKSTTSTGLPQSHGSVQGNVSDVATRLAHLGVLHWRVWAPLAYLLEQHDDEFMGPAERAKSEP